MFPSPCGVWVVSFRVVGVGVGGCFRPLAGCGLFPHGPGSRPDPAGFRPLAGCGLFPLYPEDSPASRCFRPLAGCGLFRTILVTHIQSEQFPSPCGVWVVSVDYRAGAAKP